MKLVQAREWAQAYIKSLDGYQKGRSFEERLIDAYTAGWREGWEDGELCGYNNGRDHDEVSLEIVRHAGIQEGIERMQKAYQIRPRGKSITSGYVLVPVEPTEKMIEAGEECEYFEGEQEATCADLWEAMIQAAKEKSDDI